LFSKLVIIKGLSTLCENAKAVQKFYCDIFERLKQADLAFVLMQNIERKIA